MLTRVAEKAAEVEEVDDSEDGSDEDEDEDEDEDDDSDDDDSEEDDDDGSGLDAEMDSRLLGEHAHVCVMLLLRALRIRFKRGFDLRGTSGSGGNQDEVQSVLERVYDILENESVPVRAREGCMEAIFTFATGASQSARDMLTPRTYYAIGHYMLSRHIDSSDRLSILSRVHELCSHPDDDRKANFGCLGNPMKFASLAVLCGSSRCNSLDCKAAEDEFKGLIGFLRQKMQYLIKKHAARSEKKRRKLTKMHLPERIMQFGIAMIAHFSPGDEIEGADFDDKQRMVNFLIKPFLNDTTTTTNNNYAIMVNMAQQVRNGHNVSDLHLTG